MEIIELKGIDIKDATTRIAALRKKEKWIQFNVKTIFGIFRFKVYGTWVQMAENPHGQRASGPMDCKVSEMKSFLADFMNY